jgi:hypothetical protein
VPSNETGAAIEGAGLVTGPIHFVTTQDALATPTVQSDAEGRFTVQLTLDASSLKTVLLAAPGRAGACLFAIEWPGWGWPLAVFTEGEAVDLGLGAVSLPVGTTVTDELPGTVTGGVRRKGMPVPRGCRRAGAGRAQGQAEATGRAPRWGQQV